MIQIVSFTLISAFIFVVLKSISSEYSLLVIIASGIIILGFSLNYLVENLNFFNKLFEMTGLSDDVLRIIYKITAIGYLIEFGAGTVEDFGLKSLADKLVFAGKLIILSVSLPIIYSIINVIMVLVQWENQ